MSASTARPAPARPAGWLQPLWCALAVLAVCALAMAAYLRGPLGGDFDKHFMPAERWGVPPELAARGLGVLYRGESESGWDGQFYYYIANDLLDSRHTAAHLDADAYRYQRIGLPLLAKLASVLTGQDWVSPATYYGTSLALVLAATFVGAAFLRARGLSPYWILAWALAVGTQVTVLNGLPDAAADSLLLMALAAYLCGRSAVCVPLAALAALSREGHVLFPAAILAIEGWAFVQGRDWRAPALARLAGFALPMLVFAAWQVFVRTHFVQAPSEQAHHIVGPFMESTLRHAWAGLQGAYPNTATGRHSRVAGFGVVAYLALLVTSLWVTASGLRAALRPHMAAALAGPGRAAVAVALATLLLGGLYSFFGDTVIWNFTGYMKAANAFLFLVPMLLAAWGRPMHAGFAAVALVCLVFFDYQGYRLRLAPGPVTYPVDLHCARHGFRSGDPCGERFVWDAAALPGSAEVQGRHRMARMTARSPAMYGPYLDLPAGRYRLRLEYAATAPGSRWEFGSFGSALRVAARGTLPASAAGGVEQSVQVGPAGLEKAELRVFHGGSGELRLERLSIERLVEAPR